MELHDILEILSKELPPKRFSHSLAVSETAQALAAHYGADGEKAKVAGALHDCAKPLPADALFAACRKYGIPLPEHPELQVKILHGPVGAYHLRDRFGINDPEIFDAVYYHTTGKPDMPLLTKLIFLADYIEPNRPQTPATVRLRNLAFEDLDAAILLGLDTTLTHLVAVGAPIYELSLKARNACIYHMAEKNEQRANDSGKRGL